MTQKTEAIEKNESALNKLIAKTRLQIIENGDDPDIDCFSNYDKREKDTCSICGLKTECSKITSRIKKTKEDILNVRFTFVDDLSKGRDSVSDSSIVSNTLSNLKKKHKKVKKKMAKDSLKKAKKKISDKSKLDKNGMRVVKKSSDKPEKSGDGKKKASSEASKPGRKRKQSFETLFGTTISKSFKKLYKNIKKMGTVDKKASVTNVRGDSGIIFCFPRSGSSSDKVEAYLNRSSGYEGLPKPKFVKISTHRKGDLILTIKSGKKSQLEAVELIKKWLKDRAKHLEGGSKKKASKADKKGSKKDSPKAGEKASKKTSAKSDKKDSGKDSKKVKKKLKKKAGEEE